MGLRDRNIDTIRKRLWIPPFWMQGVGMHAAADVVLHSIETVAAEYNEVTAVGMGTLQMAAGEFVNGYFPCPIDLDPKFNVGFKVCYTGLHDDTGDATVDWILLQNVIAQGIVIALPATALNTVIPDDAYVDDAGASVVTDWLLQRTARGIRDVIGLTRKQIESEAFITLKLEMNATTNLTTVNYIGMIMDYTPQLCQGVGSESDNPLQVDGVV